MMFVLVDSVRFTVNILPIVRLTMRGLYGHFWYDTIGYGYH
jgi:hypothetical protein